MNSYIPTDYNSVVDQSTNQSLLVIRIRKNIVLEIIVYCSRNNRYCSIKAYRGINKFIYEVVESIMYYVNFFIIIITIVVMHRTSYLNSYTHTMITTYSK